MSDSAVNQASAMAEGIAALREAQRVLTSDIDELMGQLNVALAQWEEPALRAYQQVQRDWDASAARQEGIIAKMSVILNTISEGYRSSERQNHGTWS